MVSAADKLPHKGTTSCRDETEVWLTAGIIVADVVGAGILAMPLVPRQAKPHMNGILGSPSAPRLWPSWGWCLERSRSALKICSVTDPKITTSPLRIIGKASSLFLVYSLDVRTNRHVKFTVLHRSLSSE